MGDVFLGGDAKRALVNHHTIRLLPAVMHLSSCYMLREKCVYERRQLYPIPLPGNTKAQCTSIDLKRGRYSRDVPSLASLSWTCRHIAEYTLARCTEAENGGVLWTTGEAISAVPYGPQNLTRRFMSS